jgi:hypothetical protein
MDEHAFIVACAFADRAWKSKRGVVLRCLAVEAVRMGARVGADIVQRSTVTLSRGPITVTIAPPPKPVAPNS